VDSASIYDIAPTLLYLLDQNVPDDMDGRVLSEAIAEQHLSANPMRTVTASTNGRASEVEFSPEENADVLERLKQLGYVG
jgi:arylsulfatase A-like enzyme